MMIKFLTKWLLGLVLCILTLAPAEAQIPAQCVGQIQKRFQDLGNPTDCDFKTIRQIMDGFDFGSLLAALNDPSKALAFKRVYTSLAEFCQLTGTHFSAKGMKGYVQLSGGVIRSDGTDFIAELKHVFGGVNAFDAEGFNKVMEQMESTGRWIAQGKWESPGGIIYADYPVNHGHRITHLFDHSVPNPGKTRHSVFSVSRDEIISLVDEGFAKAIQHPTMVTRYEANIGRVIGTNGEQKIRIIIDQNGELLTAFPISNSAVSVPGV